MLYRARARTKAPAAPAMLNATPLEGAGAPPVDFAGEVEEADAEPELEDATEEEPDEVFWAALVTDGASEVAVIEAVEAVSEATSCVVVATPTTCPSKFEEAQALTLLGSSLNQAG